MEQFSQSTCRTLTEDLVYLKGQERSPCNRVGQKKEEGRRKRRGNRRGPLPLRGELKERRDSHIKGSPLTGGEISWDRRGASRATGGGHSNQSVASRTEWDLHRWSMPQPCGPQPETCVLQCGWGLGVGRWVLESKPGERTAVGWQETAWGDGSEEIHNQECSWRKRGPHRSEASLLSDEQGAGTKEKLVG